MDYTPQTWANGLGGATPLNATRLNHMEDGIANSFGKEYATYDDVLYESGQTASALTLPDNTSKSPVLTSGTGSPTIFGRGNYHGSVTGDTLIIKKPGLYFVEFGYTVSSDWTDDLHLTFGTWQQGSLMDVFEAPKIGTIWKSMLVPVWPNSISGANTADYWWWDLIQHSGSSKTIDLFTVYPLKVS